MARAKMVFNWCIPIVLIIVALMTAAVVQAGSIKIWPSELRPQEPASGYTQDHFVVSNGHFYAPFTLPVGVRITKITYYHQGFSGALSEIYITRVKMGNLPEDVANPQGSQNSTGEIIPVEVPLSVEGDPIIRSGYRYYISADVNDSSYIWGVRITYQK